MRLKIRIAWQCCARFGTPQNLEHLATPKHRRNRHTAQRNPVDFLPGQKIEPFLHRGQLLLDRCKAVFFEIESGGHQHHAFGRYPIELIGVEIGVHVWNDVAKLVPGADDAHAVSRLISMRSYEFIMLSPRRNVVYAVHFLIHVHA